MIPDCVQPKYVFYADMNSRPSAGVVPLLVINLVRLEADLFFQEIAELI